MSVREKADNSCVYCGSKLKITREHVFPKNLFPTPRPKDLVTVPACEPCNSSYSDDDEYFRLFIVTPAFKNPLGRRMWNEKVMGSTFKRRPKLRKELVESIRKVEVHSHGGIYLGTAEAVLTDQKRIDRVFQKIVRGLYFHHFRTALPAASSFEIRANVDLGSDRAAELRAMITQMPLETIGDGSVVQYRYGCAQQMPERSIWALGFYRTSTSLVFTNPPK